jgi:tagaturonate epimerase
LIIEPYSIGVGDRFAHQAAAQLRAFQKLESRGVSVVPVWNKSNREHNFIGSEPSSVLDSAKRAVESLGWKKAWYVDADHIQLNTVDRFIDYSNFFTIDVASSIGKQASDADLETFVKEHQHLIGSIDIPGSAPIEIRQSDLQDVAKQYLLATQEAGNIFRHIESKKGRDAFITEVSMDETDHPQTPRDLLIILAALASQRIPLQTIAPKFTGRFNKGVDYVGDLSIFEKEFRSDVAVLRYAVQQFGMPSSLKLSVHSGSDKFSLYPIIRNVMHSTGAGLHLKTAGTTWLEELIGLAESEGDGLALAQEIYEVALEHLDEFCAPYASVIDIDRTKLPSSTIVRAWTGKQFANAIRHVPDHAEFNANMRQLLHVSFKVAAKKGTRFTDLLTRNEVIVSEQVTTNIFDRHLKPLFLG